MSRLMLSSVVMAHGPVGGIARCGFTTLCKRLGCVGWMIPGSECSLDPDEYLENPPSKVFMRLQECEMLPILFGSPALFLGILPAAVSTGAATSASPFSRIVRGSACLLSCPRVVSREKDCDKIEAVIIQGIAVKVHTHKTGKSRIPAGLPMGEITRRHVGAIRQPPIG